MFVFIFFLFFRREGGGVCGLISNYSTIDKNFIHVSLGVVVIVYLKYRIIDKVLLTFVSDRDWVFKMFDIICHLFKKKLRVFTFDVKVSLL